MILPKFESHHLDLHIWSYKIHKIASKQELNELAFESVVTDAWDPRVSRARWSATQNRGDGMRRRGNGEARRRRLLRPNQGHRRDYLDEPHLTMSYTTPLPSSSKDGGVHGERRRGPTVLRRGLAL